MPETRDSAHGLLLCRAQWEAVSGAGWSKALLHARERLKSDHSATFEAVLRDMASAVDVHRANGGPPISHATQQGARMPEHGAPAPRLYRPHGDTFVKEGQSNLDAFWRQTAKP